MRITESRLRSIIRSVISESNHSGTPLPPNFVGIIDCENNNNMYGGFTLSYNCSNENECDLVHHVLETDLASVWKKHDVEQYIEIDPENPLKLLAHYPSPRIPDDSFANRLLNIGLAMNLFNR